MSLIVNSCLCRAGCPQAETLSTLLLLSTPTFQQSPVNVFILRFGQSWVFVKQIGHKGKVEFGVSTDDVSWGDKLSTAESVGLLQHGFCSLHVVFLLNNTQNTHCDQRCCTAVTMWWRLSTVEALTLKPAMLMSIRGCSSSVPFGEIWFKRWK